MLGVYGAGSWGCALASVVANNTTEKVYLFGRDKDVIDSINNTNINCKYLPDTPLPSNIIATNDISVFLNNSSDILIGTPSKSFTATLLSLKLLSSHRVVCASKGLEPKTGRFLFDVFQKHFPGIPYAVLSGPSFAKEVIMKQPTAVTVAGTDHNFIHKLQEYFHCNYFRTYISEDIIGVQLGGVGKNVLAVATGIADGLGYGANTQAAIITRGMAEIRRLGAKLGAKDQTLNGLSGIGDVVLTCTDNQSRNRRFGMSLAKGISISKAQEKIGQVVESYDNVKEICAIAERHHVEMPIASQVLKVLSGESTPQAAALELVSRKPGSEG